MRQVYLDHIAATPLHPLALEAMLPFLRENFGNPQSLHSIGQEALAAVEEARARVGRLINAAETEIFFASNGSEANNFAVKGLALARRDRLRGRELGRDLVEFFANHRQPGRQRGFLLGEDPEHHRDAGDRKHDDRDRVLAVASRLAREPGAEVPPAADFGGAAAHSLTTTADGGPG